MRHWLRKHFHQRPRALPRWWRMPDQFLLRYEVRWSIRWLTRWPGFLWLLLPIIFPVLSALSETLSFCDGPLSQLASAFHLHRTFSLIMILAPLWIWLLKKRTFVVFSQKRLQELVLTRIEGRQLWPALLIAPTIIPTIIFFLTIGICQGKGIAKSVSLVISALFAPNIYDRFAHESVIALFLSLASIAILCLIGFLFIYAFTAHTALAFQDDSLLYTLFISIFNIGASWFIFALFSLFFLIVTVSIGRIFPITLSIMIYLLIMLGHSIRSVLKVIGRLKALDLHDLACSKIETNH